MWEELESCTMQQRRVAADLQDLSTIAVHIERVEAEASPVTRMHQVLVGALEMFFSMQYSAKAVHFDAESPGESGIAFTISSTSGDRLMAADVLGS